MFRFSTFRLAKEGERHAQRRSQEEHRDSQPEDGNRGDERIERAQGWFHEAGGDANHAEESDERGRWDARPATPRSDVGEHDDDRDEDERRRDARAVHKGVLGDTVRIAGAAELIRQALCDSDGGGDHGVEAKRDGHFK